MIRSTPTPNPDAYLFQVQETLIPSGTYEFFHEHDLSSSPLAQAILEIDGLELLMIAPRFITVRKFSEESWMDLLDEVTAVFEDFLASGQMAVIEVEQSRLEQANSEVEQQILDILQEEVRPAIAQDGGDFIYHGFENGIVKLELIGACGTCPSSTQTLHVGIENHLMSEIPEVKGIEQIFADAE
jgi:NFU1 iron-sulfur cluster scaffold homolog, mitochondrial